MKGRQPAFSPFVGTLIIMISGTAWSGVDTDGDGIPDFFDNCSLIPNPTQLNTDGDLFGNNCDPDIALPNDLIVNFLDLNIMRNAFFSNPASPAWNPDADFNGDNIVNFQDLFVTREFFFLAPGPGPIVPTYTNDIQPIFAEKCQPCHTGLGFGGHDIGTSYEDAFNSADSGDCIGLNIGQCALVQIQSGDMPQAGGCTGDPVLDAGNVNCLTQAQQNAVQDWLDAGLPE